MRLSRPAVRTAVAALALPLLLTACSGSTTETSSSVPSPETTTASVQITSPAPEDSSAATVPDGYQVLTSPESGISFAVPDTWVVISSDAITPEGVQLAADAMGMTTDQVSQLISNVDLYAAAATPDANGVTENMNVTSSGMADLPTQAAFEAMLSLLGAGVTVGEYSTVTTPVGDAASITYTQELNGLTMHATMTILEAPDGTYPAITVVSGSAERTAELVDVLLGSLS